MESSKSCSMRHLCSDSECSTCFERSFASFEGLTSAGTLKRECWVSELNNGKKPRNVFKSSGNKYWFRCDICEHSFSSQLDCIQRGNWCPFCSSKQLCGNDDCIMCFNASFASYNMITANNKKKIECWDYTKNDGLNPRRMSKYSDKTGYFICDVCEHSFHSKIGNITKLNRWCPYCSNQIMCDNSSCIKCFEKSLESFDEKTVQGNLKIQCLILTAGITSRMLFKHSHSIHAFRCDMCEHVFTRKLYELTNGTWCPYCCVPPKLLCDIDDCKLCFEKSFASNNMLTPKNQLKQECWSYSDNKGKTPRNTFKSSDDDITFLCDCCKHKFTTKIKSITRGSWCPYCSNPPKKMCYSIDCSFCYNLSLAGYIEKTPKNIYKIECWDYELNKTLPRHLFKSCNSPYIWFKCDVCLNRFRTTANNLTSKSKKWCPFCKHTTELKLLTFLQENYPDVEIQFAPEWCRNPHTSKLLRFDYYIPSLNLIIELDGMQHFAQVSNWEAPDDIQKRDLFKMKKAKEQGISVIRLLQYEVQCDKFDWKTHILSHCVIHEEPELVLISQSGDYPAFITDDVDTSTFDNENDEDNELELTIPDIAVGDVSGGASGVGVGEPDVVTLSLPLDTIDIAPKTIIKVKRTLIRKSQQSLVSN